MTRDEILNRIRQTHADLVAALAGIPDEVMATKPVADWWTLKDVMGHIGNCGIRLKAPGDRVAEIGYALAPDYWGHGYASEAARDDRAWFRTTRAAPNRGAVSRRERRICARPGKTGTAAGSAAART